VLLTVDGAQVPEIPLSELVVKTGAVDPEQIDAGIEANIGVVVIAHGALQVLNCEGTHGRPSA
jgi:hypothetical protein